MILPGLLCSFTLVFIGIITAVLLGVLAYRAGGKNVAPAKVIKCKVAEMRDGVCKVKGRLVAREEPLKSPMSNKPCVYYSFEVEQAYEVRVWRTTYGAESTSESESWQPIIEDVQRIAVALEDETGTAYLDLADAQTDSVVKTNEGLVYTSKESGLAFDLMLQKRYGESTLVSRRTFKSAYSRRSSRISQGSELPKAKVKEKIIEIGMEVIVVGEVETREGKPPRFRPVNHPLIVTTKARRASLPTPRNPATALWIAAGVVLGVTLLVALFAMMLACAGLGPAFFHPAHPLPGR